jgi:hypothetical protein
MTRRKIIRTSEPKTNAAKEAKEKKLSEALEGLQEMNDKLMHINVGLKKNTNAMMDEIGRCLNEIFMRLEKVEAHCGIVCPVASQTIDAPTEETATSTDSTETPSNTESPSPSVEECLAQ